MPQASAGSTEPQAEAIAEAKAKAAAAAARAATVKEELIDDFMAWIDRAAKAKARQAQLSGGPSHRRGHVDVFCLRPHLQVAAAMRPPHARCACEARPWLTQSRPNLQRRSSSRPQATSAATGLARSTSTRQTGCGGCRSLFSRKCTSK